MGGVKGYAKKGTKKVRGHTRKSYLFKDSFSGFKVEDPFAKRTQVRSHFRAKPKKRR